MKKALLSLLMAAITFTFLGCGGENEGKASLVNSENIIINKGLEIDADELGILDLREVDINGDSVKDEISLLGKGDIYNLEEYYIQIKDGKDNSNILTTFQGEKNQTNVNDFVDINDDKVLDIVLDCHNGEKFGGFVSVYGYDKGDYKKINIEEPKFNISFENNILEIREEGSKTLIKKELNKFTDKNLTFKEISLGSSFQDADGDGKKDIVKSYGVREKDSENNILEFDVIYSYRENSFKILGVLEKGSFNGAFEKY